MVIPMFGLASATIGVGWYSFAKAHLLQIAAESAWQAAEPDSSSSDVRGSIGDKLLTRLGVTTFIAQFTKIDGIASVSIEVPELQFLGPMSLVLPGLSVVSDAPSEM